MNFGMRMRDSQPCECGCGGEAKPGNRYLHGHGGKRFQPGEANIRWMGDDATRSAIHYWIHKVKPLTGVCDECGAEGRTEYSNVDHTWKRDPDDYRELCRRCHLYYDHFELGIRNPCLEQMAA